MGIPDVMHQAMKAYEPTPRNKVLAIRAAMRAVEQQIIPYAAVDAESFDREKLLSAALEMWILYVGVSTSKLLPKELREQLPPLYSQEHEADPLVLCKFFTPDSWWKWYAYEFDGLDVFFGYVVGLENELGYFTLHELTETHGPLDLPIERDLHFTPTRLSEVRRLHDDELVPFVLVLVQEPEASGENGPLDEPLGEPLSEEDNKWLQSFSITGVSRADVLNTGMSREQVNSLTDDDMVVIAEELGQAYVEVGSFWDDLEDAVKKVLQQKGEKINGNI